MSNKISQAVARCQEKESALQRTPAEKKIDNIVNSGIAIGLATAGVISLYVAGPSIQEGAALVSELGDAIQATYPNAGSYALGALAVAGITMLGLHKLEKTDQEISGTKITASTARDIRKTAQSIIQVDNAINPNIDNHKNFTAKALAKSDDQSVSIMKKHGLDPSNKSQMQSIQKAYSYGVTMATLAQSQNEKEINAMSPDQKEDFTNRKIVEAMVHHFEAQEADKGVLSMARDKIKGLFAGDDFNPHAVARSAVKAASQIADKSQQSKHNPSIGF